MNALAWDVFRGKRCVQRKTTINKTRPIGRSVFSPFTTCITTNYEAVGSQSASAHVKRELFIRKIGENRRDVRLLNPLRDRKKA